MNVGGLATSCPHDCLHTCIGSDCWESDCWCWRSGDVSWVSHACRRYHSQANLDRALNILTGLTTEHERPVYMSLLGVCWGVGTILGPVIGGAFAGGSATWRWVSVLAHLP